MSDISANGCVFVAEQDFTLEFRLGEMRMTIALLADDIIRVRYAVDEQFIAQRSWDTALGDAAFAGSKFEFKQDDDAYYINLTEGKSYIRLNKKDGCLSFCDDKGHYFAADMAPPTCEELKLEKTRITCPTGDKLPEGGAQREWHLRKKMTDNEGYYGFGQRSGFNDRRGRVVSNWTIDPPFGHGRFHDNLYQAHPFFLSLQPGFAWGCFVHSSWHSQFDVGASNAEVLEMRVQGNECDYYLFTGPTPAAVVEQLTRLTGRPFMPPMWALGYHQSRWSYYNEEEFLYIANEFRQRDIPLDVLHMDIDYMDDFRVFSFNNTRLSDVASMNRSLRKLGVRTVTIVDPGVKDDLFSGYQVALDGIKNSAFIRKTDGTLFTACVWPEQSFFPDFADASARAWWGEQHRFLLDRGISGIWNDMNEPAIFTSHFQQPAPMPLATPQGVGDERTVHAEVHNLYGQLMGRATYEGLLALRPEERPWVLTRSGFTGVQSHCAAWMGDNHSWWEHLELSLPQLAGMGLSGVPHVGVDIGGFADNSTPELFARWIEMGAFYPFMRNHTCAGTQRQEPWSFGEKVEDIARESIKMRYRLLPYFYTLSHLSQHDGMPILRPMLYDFPDDPACYHLHDQVMIGPSLLVAPILQPGRDHRAVYLPEGGWYDFSSGKHYAGGEWIIADAPLERIPVYARAGTLLPMGNVRASTDEPMSELTIAAFLGNGEGLLIEDDGISFAYQNGEICETKMKLEELTNGARFKIEQRTGNYTPAARKITLKLHVGKPISNENIVSTLDIKSDMIEKSGYPDGIIAMSWNDDGLAHDIQVNWE